MAITSLSEGSTPSGVVTINTPVIKFRSLLPSEVDVRQVGKVDGPNVNLLLYQDARCAMNILDATLGPMGWQKEYYEASGLLFCKIGIFDSASNQWVWKADTGSKSNIEEEKGLASDAFKRAAVAWGIGRELYSVPRIKVKVTDKDMYNGNFCQSFSVSQLDVLDGIVTRLVIVDKWGNERYTYTGTQGNTTVASPSYVERDYPANYATVAKQTGPVVSGRVAALNEFYSKMNEDPSVNKATLKEFYEFNTRPSKKDPTQTQIDTLSFVDLPQLWKRYCENNTARFTKE